MTNVTPVYIQQRQQHTHHQLNPVPYYAEYFGHKLHIDQNEKLIRFGVTHVAASDGYSRKLLGIISMPVKKKLDHRITLCTDQYSPLTGQCLITTCQAQN